MQDNITRERSTDSSVHREFVVVNPPMEGDDIEQYQVAVKARLDARGIDVPTPTHGKFTHATAVAGIEAEYALGLLSTTYLKTVKVSGEPRLVATLGAQERVRDPASRTAEQRARADERRGQLARGPRYYDELANTTVGPVEGPGPEAALKYARQWIGTTERPPGSNWGEMIGKWALLAGYIHPVPWCGCFANACIVAAGVPSGAGWIGYTPAIVTHSKRGLGGWSWHGLTEGQPGDLTLFDTPGGDPAIHVGLCEHRVSSMIYRTIEGNTSAAGGSQDKGGGVFRKERSSQGNFHIIGFARPPYKQGVLHA